MRNDKMEEDDRVKLGKEGRRTRKGIKRKKIGLTPRERRSRTMGSFAFSVRGGGGKRKN